MIAWLCWVYDAINDLQPMRQAAAVAHGRGVLHAERMLGLAPEQPLNHWLAAHRGLGLLLSDYYDNAHFVVTLFLVALLWWRRPDLHRGLRNTLVVMSLIGFVVFWLYPVAPPRLLLGAGFTDIVAVTHAWGAWHSGALAAHANELAAMPSLHLAWACWCALAVWRLTSRRSLRMLGVVHALLTAFAVLATANHYFADVVAGGFTLLTAILLVEVVAPRVAGRLRLARLPRPSVRLPRLPRLGGLPAVPSPARVVRARRGAPVVAELAHPERLRSGDHSRAERTRGERKPADHALPA